MKIATQILGASIALSILASGGAAMGKVDASGVCSQTSPPRYVAVVREPVLYAENAIDKALDNIDRAEASIDRAQYETSMRQQRAVEEIQERRNKLAGKIQDFRDKTAYKASRPFAKAADKIAREREKAQQRRDRAARQLQRLEQAWYGLPGD